jgi:ATP adenylyltransferase/5',5'''-P-1,P-4-tetraphosphate phosphorylase II
MNHWDRIILEDHVPGSALAPQLERLFAQQRQHWSLLREGEASLATMETKTLECSGAKVIVQANPVRKRSIHARVDEKSIAARSCFLCPENMPTEERGIGLGDLVVLPNPYPILRWHCTVPERTHRPQRLAGRIVKLLELAQAMGPEMLVFYNGARCGASAPDHFHLQACDARNIPLLSELPLTGDGALCQAHSSFGRNMLLLADPQADRLQQQFEHVLSVLRGGEEGGEPMFNLIALVRDGRYWAILFPRAAHRPSCFSAPGDARLAISPAALEMAGLLVVSDPDQLDRVDEQTAHTIYQEVSLNDTRFAQFMQGVQA